MRKTGAYFSCLLMGVASPALADAELEARLSPSPRATVAVGDWYVHTRGRAELDAVHIDNDSYNHQGGIYDRRLRFGLEAGYGDLWKATFEMDVARDEGEYTDVALEYDNQQDLRLQFGHFKEAFGMERTDSSLNVLFIERSAIDTFTPKRNLGVQAVRYGERGSLSLGAFTDSFQSNSNKDKFALTSRGTYSWPVAGGLLHAGASASWRDMEQVSFSASPDTASTDISSVATGRIRDVDALLQGALEAAYGWQNWLLSGEYMVSHISRDASSSATLDGGYVQLGWMLTGEAYRYSAAKDALFQPVQPESAWGAVELGARYQVLAMNDGSVQGGTMHAVTGGVNWYPNTAWRVSGDVSYITTDAEAVVPHDDPVVMALRLRMAF